MDHWGCRGWLRVCSSTKSLGSFHWVWLGSRLGLRSFLKVCSIAACCLRNKEKHRKGETSPSKKEGKEKKVKDDKEKDDWRVHANPSRQILCSCLGSLQLVTSAPTPKAS